MAEYVTFSREPHAGRMASCCSSGSGRGGIFCDLDQPGLAEVERLKRTGTFPRGVAVYSEADLPRAAYCVCRGRLKLSRLSPEGHAVVFALAAPGDVLGVRALLLGKPYDHKAETLEETQLCFIPAQAFLGLLKGNTGVTLRLVQQLSAELGAAYRRVCGLVFSPVDHRLAELLLALCHTHGEPAPGGIGLRADMCHDELSRLLGVSLRSLSRALGTLRDRGLIACRHRAIIVPDPAALRRYLVSSH